jgi:hypothetical protein
MPCTRTSGRGRSSNLADALVPAALAGWLVAKLGHWDSRHFVTAPAGAAGAAEGVAAKRYLGAAGVMLDPDPVASEFELVMRLDPALRRRVPTAHPYVFLCPRSCEARGRVVK